MKIPCDTIKDLLPLYHDEACSEETRTAIEAHLDECPECRKYLEEISSALEIQSEVQAQAAEKNFLKSVKKKIFRKNVIIALVAVILGGGITVGGYLYLHDYETPMWWGEGLASVSLEDDNTLYLNFGDKDYYGTYIYPLRITENGKEKNIVLVYYTSTFWTENISKGLGKANRAFGLGTAITDDKKVLSNDGEKDISAVYYYVTDTHMDSNQKNDKYIRNSIKENTNHFTTPPEGAILLWEKKES